MENQKEIVWQTQEFKFNEKDLGWYGWNFFIAFILIILSIWQKNLLFAIFIIIAEIMVVFWSKELPRDVQVKIADKGVYINAKLYPYEDLVGFHILEQQHKELILETSGRLHRYVKIMIIFALMKKIISRGLLRN